MVEVKKVVIPVDFTSTTHKVVDYATSIAEQLGAEIFFFHVINDFQGYDMMLVHPSFGAMKKDIQKEYEERMAALVEDYKDFKHGVSGKIVTGDAAEEIVKFAREIQADLIIIGTHGTKGLERVLMGSTAESVVKKANCPTLTFNPLK